jgi:hypothetical protein
MMTVTYAQSHIYAECHYAECRYAECHYLNVVMLSVIMVNILHAECHGHLKIW